MRGRFKLYRMAVRSFRGNRVMQRKWLAAVQYLREQSRHGWMLDHKVAQVFINPQQERRNGTV